MTSSNKQTADNLQSEYDKALNLAKEHYENFPVIGLFVPKTKRKYVTLIYKFARQADDISDEGTLSAEQRLNQLNRYQTSLQHALDGQFDSTFWAAVADTIYTCRLSPEHFSDLLTAFRQDITKHRYETFDELLGYCRFSANPVGRLILELNGITNEQATIYSDQICTALQLTNFWQDISVDLEKGRIYLPQADMRKFEVVTNDLVKKDYNSHFKSLLKFEIDRTKTLFVEGRQLINLLSGKLKFQIKMTFAGGEKILEKIEKSNYNVLNHRPALTKFDFLSIFLKTLFMK